MAKYNTKQKTTVRKLSMKNRSYIAGIIDGDGCIKLSKNRKGFVTVVQVSNSSIELIKWLKEKIGDFYIEVREPAKYKDGYNHKKIRRTFSINSKIDVKNLLSQIINYLIIKKEKARIVLRYLDGEIDGKKGYELMKKVVY